MGSKPPLVTQAPVRFEAVPALRDATAAWRRAGERIVLVPTMGALHAGHLALVERARSLGERVVVSLFVNPTQFGPNEDFARYPRDTEADLGKLGRSGADAVWMPAVETMYPAGFASRIEVADLTQGLCGACRPGHFSGVATVVTKLLNQVRPDAALFGEKDFQQLQVIRRVVRDLDMAVAIEGMPTLREEDGLALSSRNRYLTAEERRIAPQLHRTLEHVASLARSGGEVSRVISEAVASLERAGFSPVQYVAVCDAGTLRPLDRVEGPARVLAAAYLGSTRLIDNVPV